MKLRQLKEYDNIQLREDYAGTLTDQRAIEQDPNRTPGKDKTAKWINENIVKQGRWPVAATTLEDEISDDPEYDGPTSRQHITNSLAGYFEGVEESQSYGDPVENHTTLSAGPDEYQPPKEDEHTADESHEGISEQTQYVYIPEADRSIPIDIEIPADVDQASYVRGYIDCRMKLSTFTEVD